MFRGLLLPDLFQWMNIWPLLGVMVFGNFTGQIQILPQPTLLLFVVKQKRDASNNNRLAGLDNIFIILMVVTFIVLTAPPVSASVKTWTLK